MISEYKVLVRPSRNGKWTSYYFPLQIGGRLFHLEQELPDVVTIRFTAKKGIILLDSLQFLYDKPSESSKVVENILKQNN